MKKFEDEDWMRRIDELLVPLLIKAEQQRSNGFVNDRNGEPFDKEAKDSSCSE